MKKVKKYTYIGKNGTLTTFILLENVPHTESYELIAEPGMILTDGHQQVSSITLKKEELKDWHEVELEANLNK